VQDVRRRHPRHPHGPPQGPQGSDPAGHEIFKDAAAKNLVPGDIAARGDALLLRWAGNVQPKDPQAVKDDAARLVAVAEKTLPVLKTYTVKDKK
jgi:hypothetical protein